MKTAKLFKYEHRARLGANPPEIQLSQPFEIACRDG